MNNFTKLVGYKINMQNYKVLPYMIIKPLWWQPSQKIYILNKQTWRISSYELDKKRKNYVEKHKPDGYKRH